MGAISGTILLLYSEGLPIAMQKGLSIALDMDLPDATNKDSAGWAQHILGMRNAKIDFSALANVGLPGDTPPVVMSAKALMDYIIAQESLLVSILGLGYPIVGEVDISSLSFDAPGGGVMTLAGSLTVNGALYVLSGVGGMPVNLITDPDGSADFNYDTLTVSGLNITSAIKSSAGEKYCNSNTISVNDTYIYKLAVFLTLNGGTAPTVGIWDNTSAFISNTQVLVDGLNFVTLTATATDASASLRFRNTANGSWATSPIYFFKPI
jgi:predicted secreted protein